MSTITKQRGFTLAETVIYTAGVVMLIGVITGMLFYMYDWYDRATFPPRVDQTGITILDHFLRDVRAGSSVDSANSALGLATSTISINSKVGGLAVTKAYSVVNNRLQFKDYNGTIGYLSPTEMSVTKFLLNQINTPISTAIRVELELTYNTRQGTTTRSYSGVAIMRNSY